MQQSKIEGSYGAVITYSLRTTLILSAILAVGSFGAMSYCTIEMLQATQTDEAIWLKGQVLLWLLWVCVWGFQLILGFSAWKKASPEQKRAPAIRTDPLNWKYLFWQSFMMSATMGTCYSYQTSDSPGRPVHELASVGQYWGYFSLLPMLIWMGASVLRLRFQRTV